MQFNVWQNAWKDGYEDPLDLIINNHSIKRLKVSKVFPNENTHIAGDSISQVIAHSKLFLLQKKRFR